MGIETATIETLTASVRVLMIGNRQITMSIFKQLDEVRGPYDLEPFGRIGYRAEYGGTWIVGRSLRERDRGALVRHCTWGTDLRGLDELPLIVLAGLR
jgi:hypothetical protein